MSATRTLWMLALLSLVLPGSTALPGTLLGDAGGPDAGATAATATALPYGSYSANLTPGDIDWFAFPPTSGACVDVSLLTSHAMQIGIALDGEEVLAARPAMDGVLATTLALAPGTPGIVARPDSLPWDGVSAGPYSFEIAPIAPGGAFDGLASWTDGPGTIATADPLPASCFTGYFHWGGNDIDVVSFAAGEGDVATLSLATATGAGSATLVDSAGALLGAPVVAGEAATFSVPSAGQYFLVLEGVAAPEKYAYTVALVVGPPGQGCRPACIDL